MREWIRETGVLKRFLAQVNDDVVIVELIGVSTGSGEFETLFEFGNFEGGLNGWFSYSKRN